MATTFAPAVAPLWAMGVAIAIAFDQWWPCNPGMFEGKRKVTVGTFQDTSPISSEPPLTGFGRGFPSGDNLVAKPEVRREFTSC